MESGALNVKVLLKKFVYIFDVMGINLVLKSVPYLWPIILISSYFVKFTGKILISTTKGTRFSYTDINDTFYVGIS